MPITSRLNNGGNGIPYGGIRKRRKVKTYYRVDESKVCPITTRIEIDVHKITLYPYLCDETKLHDSILLSEVDIKRNILLPAIEYDGQIFELSNISDLTSSNRYWLQKICSNDLASYQNEDKNIPGLVRMEIRNSLKSIKMNLNKNEKIKIFLLTENNSEIEINADLFQFSKLIKKKGSNTFTFLRRLGSNTNYEFDFTIRENRENGILKSTSSFLIITEKSDIKKCVTTF